MAEGVRTYGIIVFADKSAFCIVDSFRYANDDVAIFLKGFLYCFKERFLVKCSFRKIDQQWIISCIFTCKSRRSCKPSCVAPHDFYDSYRFLLIDICIYCNLTDCRCYISGSASKSWSVICVNQIVVDSLRFSNDTDITSSLCCISGKFAYCIHRIISADVEEPANIHFFKFLKKFRIDRIFQ